MTIKDIKVVPEYFTTYTNKVDDSLHLMEALETYGIEYLSAHRDSYEAIGDQVYAPGKWTIKQALVHVIDTERIFSYRALRFARGDQSALVGFEQDGYAADAQVRDRSIESVLDEYAAVRHSSICLYESLDEERLSRHGKASGKDVSVLALGFMTCGHVIHHQNIIEERYFPLVE